MKFWIIIGTIIGVFVTIVALNKSPGTGGTAGIGSAPGDLAAMVGQPAPDFSLPSLNGEPMRLSSLRGKKVVLFFSEGIMCYPACWNQMAALGTDEQLNSDEVVSVAIVTDSREQWAQAVLKMPELSRGVVLLDTDKTVSRQYGVLSLPSSMHRGSSPGHTYLVLDEYGVVRHTEDDQKMGIHNDKLIEELAKI